MSRTANNYRFFKSDISDLSYFVEDPRQWLENKIDPAQANWLLAFADDGVITGSATLMKQLTLSCDNDPQAPQLNLLTLQRLHLFNEKWEIRIWKFEGKWRGFTFTDQTEKEFFSFDEKYLLWGTSVDESSTKEVPDGFSLVVEGERGQHFVLPLKVDSLDGEKRASLKIRHYVDFNGDGEAHIITSRLLSFSAK